MPKKIAKELAKLRKGLKLACGKEPDDYHDANAPTRVFCPWHVEAQPEEVTSQSERSPKKSREIWFQGERDTEGHKDGRGVVLDKGRGLLSILRFKRDWPHGVFLSLNKHGEKEIGTYKNGIVSGKLIQFLPNGVQNTFNDGA